MTSIDKHSWLDQIPTLPLTEPSKIEKELMKYQSKQAKMNIAQQIINLNNKTKTPNKLSWGKDKKNTQVTNISRENKKTWLKQKLQMEKKKQMERKKNPMAVLWQIKEMIKKSNIPPHLLGTTPDNLINKITELENTIHENNYQINNTSRRETP